MPRPAAALLKVVLPCPPLVDVRMASQACAHAGSRCGYTVADRSEASMVLLPCVRPSMSRCIIPGLSSPSSAAHQQSGQGIAAAFHADGPGGSVRISLEAPQGPRGEAFMAALRARLLATSSHKAAGSAAGHIAPLFPCDESAYLFVSRLLSDQQQAPGRLATEFLREFSGRYSEATAVLDANPDPRRGPVAECASAVTSLCRAVADSLSEPSGLPDAAHAAQDAAMPWLRGAVERWVLSRVGPMLWRLFESQNGAEDRQFVQKSRALAAVSDAALFESLEVPEAFRRAAAGKVRKEAAPRRAEAEEDGVSEYGATRSESTCSTAATCADAEAFRGAADEKVGKEASPREGAADVQDGSGCSTPYERVASALRRVEVSLRAGCSSSPRAAVEALTALQRDMKECAYEASGEHLSAMDDIMPVFIFVLLRSSASSPVACAKLMSQALTADEQLGSEGRAVLLLECAARYVASHWDIQELTAN